MLLIPVETWRTCCHTRRGTKSGRKLIRHIQLGVNTRILLYITGSEPTKDLFNVNSSINTLSSDFRSKSINVIVSPRRR